MGGGAENPDSSILKEGRSPELSHQRVMVTEDHRFLGFCWDRGGVSTLVLGEREKLKATS